MPSKKSLVKNNKFKNKNKQSTKKWQRKHRDDRRHDRISTRNAIIDPTSNHRDPSAPLGSLKSNKVPRVGQALAKTSPVEESPWQNNFHYGQHPQTTPQSPPLFSWAGSPSIRQCTRSANDEARSPETLAPMMAPGHEQQQQQQRNHQPPYHRQYQQQQPSNSQRTTVPPSEVSVNGEQRGLQAKDRDVEREQPRKSHAASTGTGPMQSHIQVAKPYVFQQAIDGCLKDVGVAQPREDNIRLAGVQWIDNVRRALKLPVRTFDTAVVYYHKFRLVHSDGEYSFVDAAAAALFAACKIEDTLKKSRDILCAAHNLKAARNEHLSPDDTVFEHHSRTIIGLERLMLEASSFDFRNRHPQTLMIKLAKYYNLGPPQSSSLVKTAYSISLDLYRTFAPLKQNTATMAFACLELAIRLHNETDNQDEGIQAIIGGQDYDRWGIGRAEVMETLLDLLEVYTHYRGLTVVGPDHPLEAFLNIRIPLNDELSDSRLPRFTESIDTGHSGVDPAGYAATVNGISAASSGAAANGTGAAAASASDTSPTSPSSATGGKSNGIRQKAGERGREGTVRFMLNPDRERQERLVAAEYHPQPSQQQQPTSQPQSTPQTPTQTQAQSQSQSQPQQQQQQHSQHPAPPSGPSHSHNHGPGSGRNHGPGPGPNHSHSHGHSHGHGHGHNARPPPSSSSDRTDRNNGGPRTGDRDRDRDRDRERHRDRDRERDRNRDRDRDRDQDRGDRDRDRDRDRDWDRDRDRERPPVSSSAAAAAAADSRPPPRR